MRRRASGPARAVGRLGALALGLVLACVVNPVTGQREISLMSVGQERALGAQAAEEVQTSIGLVRDPALEPYVRRIGERLAAFSPRRDVEYRFFVADMEEPNAFALPGGYIYVSRGLLAIANSEAELANVIGHEIGHVAALHAAQRQTRSLGASVAAVLAGAAAAAAGGGQAGQAVGSLAQVAGAGLIASYGRDQERQADEVGQQLAASAGFDPAAMASFLATLEREMKLRNQGQERRPSFLDSHPMTAERVQATAARARALQTAPAAPIAGSRADFYRRLEGLLVGPDPAKGVFRESRFLHPGLGFAVDFPRGWRTQNGADAVAAQSPEQDALVLLEGQGPTGDPGDAAQRFAQQNGLELLDVRRLRIGGLEALHALARARTQQGEVGLDLTWIAHPRATFRITGLAPVQRFDAWARTFESTARSFRPLTEAERGSITELRLRVVAARAGERLSTLTDRTGNAWSVAETAVANGLPADVSLGAGAPVKIAERVPFRSR